MCKMQKIAAGAFEERVIGENVAFQVGNFEIAIENRSFESGLRTTL